MVTYPKSKSKPGKTRPPTSAPTVVDTSKKNKKFKGKCYNCNKWGHCASECKQSKRGESSTPTTDNKANVLFQTVPTNFVAMVGKGKASTEWWLDSGATCHVCNNPMLLEDVTAADEIVTVANGEIADVLKVGTATLLLSSGRNVLTWHGSTPRLVVGEAELAKEILTDREGGFPKYEPPVFMKKLLGFGLVTSNGQKWVRQRKLATHAFRSESLKGMIPAIIASVESMLQKWAQFEGREIDFFKEFATLTSEIISRTAFGSSYVEGKNIFIKIDELTAIYARNFQAIRLPFFRKFMPNQDDIESEKIDQLIRGSILKLIKRREEIKKNGDDLLGSLMRAHHENEGITIDDIIDECKTFYFTGQETTSVMLSWTALLLAINTDWQDKVRLEVLQLFGDRTLTSEDFSSIAKLKKITMVMNESMRLYPPVLNILRRVEKKCRVGNVVLPKGMQIQISPLVIHHDLTGWGEDAQLFLPERFGATAAAGGGGGGGAFFPFGVGPRFCVGQGLAMLQGRLVLSMILRRYSFSLSPAYAHSPVSRLSCRPQHGVQVVLQKL